jgi:hypothetical protein
MNSKDILPGRKYALREPANPTELQCVRAAEHIRRDKWRVEWIEPNPGLVDFVKSREILYLWTDRKKFLRDETKDKELRTEAKRYWPGEEHPLNNAIYEVFESTGEQVNICKGVLSGLPDSLGRISKRATYEWPYSTTAYSDRFGIQHYPWDIALGLAKAFAAAEPNTVLLHIEVCERNWEIEVREAGGSYLIPLLEHYRAAWSIVRQWAGFDADRLRFEAEIERLRELIDKTIWRLREKDLDPERLAAWLSRARRGG